MDEQIALRVASRWFESDSRYRPPKWLVNGVDAGELPTKALLIWKYNVERLGAKFSYPAAIQYWRNKCRKEGIDLAEKFLTGGKGADFGPWKIKTGDQIEEWVKERLKSEGLISDVARTAAEWQLEIAHLEQAIADAQERIAKHEAVLAKGKDVKRRTKWLASAKSDLESGTKELDKAKVALSKLTETAQRHETHKAPVVEFEKQFQFALQLAMKDLEKDDIVAAARAAIAKFEGTIEEAAEAEEEAPATTPSAPPAMGEEEPIPPTMRTRYMTAGFLEDLWKGAQKVWSVVKGAFSAIADWTKDLLGLQKKLDKMLTQAGAKK
jgi:hypothetical protein